MPGETIASGAPATCPECGVTPDMKVYLTCGYYVGTWCDCGPYSRESGYYRTEEEAEAALRTGEFGRGGTWDAPRTLAGKVAIVESMNEAGLIPPVDAARVLAEPVCECGDLGDRDYDGQCQACWAEGRQANADYAREK